MLVGKTLLSRYQVTAKLGSGGFGDTYKAIDLALPGNPPCVVKHLSPKFQDPQLLPIAKKLFEREAEYLYRLGKHDQIPYLYAHFEEGGEFYLVQDFVDGNDLSQEIVPGKKLREEQTIQILQEILEVLAVVHQQNIIHRDIKPQNIMRRYSDNKLMLIDFGAVKELSGLSITSSGDTSVTVTVGSPGYMPNEQANGKPKLASDIYAVGMVCIQALTGMIPEQMGEDPRTGEILWRNQAQVSNHLAGILSKMVRDHFSQRYQNASEVLQALASTQVTLQTPPLPETLLSVNSPSASEPESQLNQPDSVETLASLLEQTLPKTRRLSCSSILIVIGVTTVFGGLLLSRITSSPLSPLSMDDPIDTNSTESASIPPSSPDFPADLPRAPDFPEAGVAPPPSSSDEYASNRLPSNVNLLRGNISIDGSSNVFPLSQAMAKKFGKLNQAVKFTISLSGSGGGFKKFCNGEMDISQASRPIKQKEIDLCRENGIEFIEIPVAYDALSVIVNQDNNWAKCLSTEELSKMWEPGADSIITNWNQIKSEYPNEFLRLYSSGTDTRTYDYFTEAIIGDSRSRIDFTSSEDNNILVQGVKSNGGSLAFFDYLFYNKNRDTLKAVAIKNAEGECVQPNPKSIADGSYNPLSRPLFFYVNKAVMEAKPAVKAFAEFQIQSENSEIIADVGYIPLPSAILSKVQDRLANATTGSIFEGGSSIGVNLSDKL